ncbi:MBL fold metallo-hydrolase [Opitutales bacterium]|nr:MBL fold metallo-hydrolase [Opitutales bacterium]
MVFHLNIEEQEDTEAFEIRDSITEDELIKIANTLNLDCRKLIVSFREAWFPNPIRIGGLKQFKSSFGDMVVNSFLIWDEITSRSWIFDTGTEVTSVLQFIAEKELQVDALFLTHTHRDHIACLDELRGEIGNPSVYVHQLEFIDGCEAIEEGFKDSLGSLSLEALHTHGHSVGGLSYVISGLPCPVAIVGDAIFAGSMGGGMVSYQDALRTNRDKIMTLPDETVLCPGHGPITTVKEEKEHNPFFPEF